MMITIQGWIYIGLALFALTGWGYGYYESSQYNLFRTKVESEAIVAKGIADRTDAWNNKVIKETNDAYQKRMANIDTKYGRLYDHGTCAVPSTNTRQDSTAPIGSTTNNVPIEVNLPRDCAITTNMLVTLQEILKTTKDQP